VLVHSTAVVVGWMKMSSVHYSAPVLHDLIRKPCIINYNTKLYPFREAILDILNEDSSHGDDDDNNTGGRNGGLLLSRDSDLSSLHMMGDACIISTRAVIEWRGTNTGGIGTEISCCMCRKDISTLKRSINLSSRTS
jgi:hypothetical protein